MSNQSQVALALKAAAIYDLLATAVLVLPPLVPLVFGAIYYVDGLLGFDTPFLPMDRTTVFFVNLAAATVIAWSAIRLRAPSADLLRIDIAYRAVLVLCQIWAVLQGATPVLLGIGAVLVLVGLYEFLALRPNSKPTRPAETSPT